MKHTSPCVCVQHESQHEGAETHAVSKTTRRQRVCSLTHGLSAFISLLLLLSSSSKRNRIVFYSLTQGVKDYETYSNGRGNI